MSRLFAVALLGLPLLGSAQSQPQPAAASAAEKSRRQPAATSTPEATRPFKSQADVQKYVDGLKASLQKKISFADREANDEKLWAAVRQMAESDLRADWTAGILLGKKPQEAFFVKCDRTTMTQNDLDNGRMVMMIGVAPVKPAEFVIFRIGQQTADARKKPSKRPHRE